MRKSFIQFELWKDCKQGCKFCCNKGQKPVNKAESCNYVLDILNNLTPCQYSYIGLIGGEFFNGEMELHMNHFFKIMRRIAELKPEKVLIATSLIYNMEDYLIPVLKAVKEQYNLTDKIVLCTSWDIKGRFHSPEQVYLWESNMKRLQEEFPEVERHIEIILTQAFIDLVNQGNFSIKDMETKYDSRIDFIEPASGLYYKDKEECQTDIPYFFPTKSSFIQFLQNVEGETDLNQMLSMESRSETLYYIADRERKVAKNRRVLGGKCEVQGKNYDIGFIDSDIPMRSIVEEYANLTN